MTTSETAKIEGKSLSGDLRSAARYYLGNRRVLLILAIVAIVGGLAFNWSWLVAAGVAPVLLTTLPCLVMCGLGRCMHKMVGGSCAPQSTQSQTAESTAQPSVSAQTVATTKSPLAGITSCCGTVAGAQTATEPRPTQTLDERRTPHA